MDSINEETKGLPDSSIDMSPETVRADTTVRNTICLHLSVVGTLSNWKMV